MRTYHRTTTRTKSTMRHRSKLTRILVSGSVMLGLVSFISWPGLKQDSAPSASQMLPLTAESLVEEAPSPMPTMFVELESVVEPEPEVVAKYSSYEVTLVCQTVYGEARGCSKEEQMLVVWCICNRADSTGASIEQIVTAPRQFHGYDSENPVTDEIRRVVLEVLDAWSRGQEALVYEPYATTSEYLYFSGDGVHNWFREEY